MIDWTIFVGRESFSLVWKSSIVDISFPTFLSELWPYLAEYKI